MEQRYALMQSEPQKCYSVWQSNNLPVEISYAMMCLLFITQAFYAATKRAKIAIQFDIPMAIGCSLPIGLWLDQHWLL